MRNANLWRDAQYQPERDESDDAPMLTPEEDRALSLELDRENAEANPPEEWETTVEDQSDSLGCSHTPGPWHVDKLDICTDASGATIAEIYPNGFGPGQRITAEEREANALIIAAAPDLLQALEELLAAAERHDSITARAYGFQLAEDAVRKAKGLDPIARFPTVGERGVW